MTAVAVVLAAGAGRRLGGVAKALLAGADGRTFLARVRDAALVAGVRDAIVVVGPPYGDRVRAEAERLGMRVVDNPAPERGMASSVARGFDGAARAFGDAAGGLLWPVDHARVAPRTVRLIVDAGAPGRIAVPAWRGRGGHPTWFGREVWPALARCDEAPDGARSVVRADPARVVRLDVDDRGVVADVDTPEALP